MDSEEGRRTGGGWKLMGDWSRLPKAPSRRKEGVGAQAMITPPQRRSGPDAFLEQSDATVGSGVRRLGAGTRRALVAREERGQASSRGKGGDESSSQRT